MDLGLFSNAVVCVYKWVLILTTQLLEEVSHTVEEVDYTEAKASYNLSKNRYADKLPSELRNTLHSGSGLTKTS